jgi:predicted secreted protein
MAAGTGFIGFGSKLSKGATIIGEILSISGPAISTDAVEITHTESPSACREYIAGLIEPGELSVELQVDTAGSVFALLIADQLDRSIDAYTLLFSNTGASTLTFNAFVTGVEFNTPIDDRATVTASFKITGLPTWTT